MPFKGFVQSSLQLKDTPQEPSIIYKKTEGPQQVEIHFFFCKNTPTSKKEKKEQKEKNNEEYIGEHKTTTLCRFPPTAPTSRVMDRLAELLEEDVEELEKLRCGAEELDALWGPPVFSVFFFGFVLFGTQWFWL